MAGVGSEEEVKREEKGKVATEATPKKYKDGEEVVQEEAAEEEKKLAEEVSTKVEEMKVSSKEGDAKVDEKEKVTQVEDEKMDVEPKTGVSFPVRLADGKQLNSMGIRKKKILALGINIYAFGMYSDNVKLKDLLISKLGKAPEMPTKELYEAAINSDIGMVVRLVIVFNGLTMSMVRKNFDEGLGASLKKVNGGRKNEELVNKVMGAASDSIKLSTGSIIEITRFPGYVLQTIVKGELISKVESELLCRAYFNMYLGDDPFDKEAKERFGASLLSLF